MSWMAAATIGSALLGRNSAKSTNKQQAGMTREQMDFQERMSNTAYQRAMADMMLKPQHPLQESTALSSASLNLTVSL